MVKDLAITFENFICWRCYFKLQVISKCIFHFLDLQMQYVYLGGRLTFINSVLDSIPTSCMSLF